MARNRDRRVSFKTQKRYKDAITGLITGLSRKVTIYLPETRTECPNCYYDKVNDKGSGIPKVPASNPNYFTSGRCPVCYNAGVLATVRRRCIDAVVIWNPTGNSMNSLTFTESGYDGATSVELKTDVCNLEVVRDCDHAIIDGVTCKLSNPPIIRGLGNKAILSAIFFTSYKPLDSSNETI